jgi:hypothetical protein
VNTGLLYSTCDADVDFTVQSFGSEEHKVNHNAPAPAPLLANTEAPARDLSLASTMYQGHDLLRAAYRNDIHCVASLLEAGSVDLNEADTFGATALHLACSQGHYEVARLLIEWGANAYLRDTLGNRPLDLYPWKDQLMKDNLAQLVRHTHEFEYAAHRALGDSQRDDNCIEEMSVSLR